jgi:hypothetical protein
VKKIQKVSGAKVTGSPKKSTKRKGATKRKSTKRKGGKKFRKVQNFKPE